MSDPVGSIAHVRGLEGHLGSCILGQGHILPRLSAAFVRGALGLVAPDRPLGSVLLVGPTGTGKTEIFTRAIDYLHGPGHLVVFDLSEYQDDSALGKLLGDDRSDPGLLGRALAVTGEGGVLFDEIEKAHPRVLDLMLQILWHGRITVATGQTFRLGKYFIGFTSNIGSADAMRMEHSRQSSVEQAVLRAVDRTLRPELVGRIDEKFVFARLGHEVQREICALEVQRETARLAALGHDLVVSAAAMDLLVREGFHPHLGARPLRRTVERQLQNAVVDGLFTGRVARGRLVPDALRQTLIIDPVDAG